MKDVKNEEKDEVEEQPVSSQYLYNGSDRLPGKIAGASEGEEKQLIKVPREVSETLNTLVARFQRMGVNEVEDRCNFIYPGSDINKGVIVGYSVELVNMLTDWRRAVIAGNFDNMTTREKKINAEIARKDVRGCINLVKRDFDNIESAPIRSGIMDSWIRALEHVKVMVRQTLVLHWADSAIQYVKDLKGGVKDRESIKRELLETLEKIESHLMQFAD